MISWLTVSAECNIYYIWKTHVYTHCVITSNCSFTTVIRRHPWDRIKCPDLWGVLISMGWKLYKRGICVRMYVQRTCTYTWYLGQIIRKAVLIFGCIIQEFHWIYIYLAPKYIHISLIIIMYMYIPFVSMPLVWKMTLSKQPAPYYWHTCKYIHT